MNPDELNPDDTLAALGLTTNEAAPGAGYQAPTTDPITGLPTEMAKPGEALPEGQRNGALEQARVLATLAGKDPRRSGMDRFAEGLGAKLGQAPQHPVAAALDGGISGFAAAYGGAKKKGGLSDIKERMGLLKTLFDMDRSLAKDRTADAFRERALTATERRTDAYLQRQGLPNGGKPQDPLVREKNIIAILKEKPAHKALKDDDEKHPRLRLKPEARAALEAEAAKERAEVEAMGGGGGTPAPILPPAPTGTPAPAAPRAITTAPATPSPKQKPVPVDSGAPSVNPAATAPVDPAIPAPAKKATAQTAAPKAPTLSREQIIEQGRAANERGAPLEAIIGRAKQNGFDLKPDDFLRPAPAQQQPTSQAPTDPMGNSVGPQSGIDPQQLMGVLASLFG